MGLEDFVGDREQGTGVAKGKRYYGKYVGLVRDTNDPETRGRVRFFCPEVMGELDDADHWLHFALPSYPVAGGMDVGAFLVPPESGQIPSDGEDLDIATDPEAALNPAPVNSVRRDVACWIEFRQGDPRFPIYTGFFYFTPDDLPNYGPKLVRGEQDETLLPPVGAFRVPNQTVTVTEAAAGTTATVSDPVNDTVEPPPQNETIYPLNRVYKSPGGHVVEFDDTPNQERIRIYHKSGGYLEFNAGGTLVTKAIGQLLTFVNEDEIHCVLQNARRIINGSYHHQVGGNYTAIRNGTADLVYRDGLREFSNQKTTVVAGKHTMELGSLECSSGGDVLFTSANGVGMSGQNANLLGLIEAQITCPTGVTLQGTTPATIPIYDSISMNALLLPAATALQAASVPAAGPTPTSVEYNALVATIKALAAAMISAFGATNLTIHRASKI